MRRLTIGAGSTTDYALPWQDADVADCAIA